MVAVAGAGFVPTYYVGAGGNDSNDGLSWVNRWLTLAKVAAFTFLPGNRVLLDGTFNETLTLVAARHNGITLGIVGAGATIHGQDTRANCVDATACNNLTVNDITLQDPTQTGFLLTSGTHTFNRVISDGSGDQAFQCGGGLVPSVVTLNNCTLSGAGDDGVSFHPGNGISATLIVNGGTISGNVEGFQDAGAFAGTVVFNGVTFNNNTKSITSSAFVTITCNRSLFKGMAGASTKALQGIIDLHYCIINTKDSVQSNTQIASPGAGAAKLRLFNSTLYGWSGSNTRGGVTATGGTSEIEFFDCIADRLWRLGYIEAGCAIDADHSNFNGITTKNLTTNVSEVAGNPLLVDPANDDFRLQAGSPARNAGTTYAGQLTTDYAGNAVASPPSLGALEYVA